MTDEEQEQMEYLLEVTDRLIIICQEQQKQLDAIGEAIWGRDRKDGELLN